jgi:beta-glucosidase
VYKSEEQLPPFDDYNMQGRTYKYFEDVPCYPFGYGLSYTQFEYSDLKMDEAVSTGQNIKIEVTLNNAGNFDGDEVVQVYASHKDDDPNTATRSLVAFERIHLLTGESKRLTFEIEPRQLSVIDENGDRVLSACEIEFSVGGGQPLDEYKNHNAFISSTVAISGKQMIFKH